MGYAIDSTGCAALYPWLQAYAPSGRFAYVVLLRFECW